MENMPKRNPQLNLLLIILIVVIGVSISIMTINYSIKLEASVANTGFSSVKDSEKNDKMMADEMKSQSDEMMMSLETGEAKKVDISEKLNNDIRKIVISAFGVNGVPAEAYVYYCRDSSGAGFLYQTQVNLGSSYSNSFATCVQIVDAKS